MSEMRKTMTGIDKQSLGGFPRTIGPSRHRTIVRVSLSGPCVDITSENEPYIRTLEMLSKVYTSYTTIVPTLDTRPGTSVADISARVGHTYTQKIQHPKKTYTLISTHSYPTHSDLTSLYHRSVGPSAHCQFPTLPLELLKCLLDIALW